VNLDTYLYIYHRFPQSWPEHRGAFKGVQTGCLSCVYMWFT